MMFLHYNEKIKTTRDQVTTQSNIPVSNFVLLNSVDSLIFQGGLGTGRRTRGENYNYY